MNLDLATVAGVAETALSTSLVDRLPDAGAPAPWTVSCTGLWWLARGSDAARRALPVCVRSRGSRAIGVIGGFVDYSDTPVGRYREVFGGIGFHRGLGVRANVAFMAVDSTRSVVGGRGNWALPKTLARFDGSAAGTVTAHSADGEPWLVSATPKPFGVRLPLRSSFMLEQQAGDGTMLSSRMRAKGTARSAIVHVDVDSTASLPTWLRPGSHLGLVIESMTFTLDAPTSHP